MQGWFFQLSRSLCPRAKSGVASMALHTWLPLAAGSSWKSLAFCFNRTGQTLWDQHLEHCIAQRKQSKWVCEHHVELQGACLGLASPCVLCSVPLQTCVWRLRAGKAAQLLHGGAGSVHRQHWCCCWWRELQVCGISESRSKASGTATSKSGGPRVTTDAPEPTTRPPVTRTARRLWWENSISQPECRLQFLSAYLSKPVLVTSPCLSRWGLQSCAIQWSCPCRQVPEKDGAEPCSQWAYQQLLQSPSLELCENFRQMNMKENQMVYGPVEGVSSTVCFAGRKDSAV